MLKECCASEFGYGYRKKNTILALKLKYLSNYNDINCEPNALSDMFIFLCLLTLAENLEVGGGIL